MNTMQKSEAIKNGLRKGFQGGSSRMANCKCYGYDINPDGELAVNPDEAKVVCWIFQQYLAGDSLGKIAAGLERRGIPSPTGRPKWNREAIDKLLSNEKYTGRVLLQKTISTGAVQIENDGLFVIFSNARNFSHIIMKKMENMSYRLFKNHLSLITHFVAAPLQLRPAYPQGGRRIRKAAEPPTAAQAQGSRLVFPMKGKCVSGSDRNNKIGEKTSSILVKLTIHFFPAKWYATFRLCN